uniref:Uncharacterized protein n=1 Tax=viral metagenome TaxID=1070528 RepID=A0A6H1ZM56_9ZZZZ
MVKEINSNETFSLEELLADINYNIRDYPRRFTKRKLREQITEKHPTFTLCLISKCHELKLCWNLKTLHPNPKRLNYIGKCDNWLKVLEPKRLYLPKTKSRFSYSNMEIALLNLALLNLTDEYKNKEIIKNLIVKLNQSYELFGTYISP